MAKRIIILDTIASVAESTRTVRAVFWFTVTDPEQRVPRPAINQSVYPDATSAEIDLLKTGEVREESYSQTFALSASIASIRNALEAAWTARSTELTSYPPGQYYGAFWNGTGWVN